ncbi:YdcF family protein [Aquibium carbonis]|uniref:YdcF family protein n=1 Tax=Aquibium carbonis TaxID=2495581 RepID=A0A3S0G9C8_9HYPH|nr:YdcF family protein [Aquibium carbonis]RST86650.1 YdcF family protein [Aquibium carbonis]
MFFIASKIFWMFANPLTLAAILALASFLLILAGWRRLAASAAGLGFLVLAVSGWTTAGALLLHPLEDRFQRPSDMPARVDGIVVLGGGFEGGVNRVRGGYELNSSGDRFVETAALALRYPEARVLVSGGAGALLLEGEGDGETAPRLLEALGVDRSRLLLDNEARNTQENALFSKRLADPQEGETWLLVTSAFHMPRSVGLFRKADFAVVPWPSDYRTSGVERIGPAEDNVFDSTQNTALAIREWIGLLVYWLTGRIDTLLPGPDGQGTPVIR